MRTSTTAAVTLLLTSLTACGVSSKTTAASSAAPVSVPTPTIALASKDGLFLASVKQAGIASWVEAAPSDRQLLSYPDLWCTGLDEGRSAEYLFSSDGGLYPIGWGWSTKKPDAYKVLVLAVSTYCPEHRDRVMQEVREDGEH